MLGASVTVVLTRRCCRQGNGDNYSHPFPEEGGISLFKDTRDEQEKRWIENRRAYSEGEYETDSSSGAFSPNPRQSRRLPGRTRLDSTEFSPDHEDLRAYAVAKTDVPISESFYDEALAENQALELNLSSDEEPPAPYAQLRGDSIRRVLFQNINQERNRSLEEHENATAPLRMRQKTFSQSTRSSRIPPGETIPFSISSPAQRTLSPRQMQELFFVDHALSGNQWATAERLLAEDEDSDEENAVKRAILHAGSNERRGHSQDHMPPVQSKGIPPSMSALSTAVASRRLVKPAQEGSVRPMQVTAVQEHREEDRANHKGRKETDLLSAAPGYGAAALPAGALGRVADIISTSWSQRDVTSRYMSATGFGSSVSSSGTQQVREQPIQARTVRFGLRKGEDGIEHRLGFIPKVVQAP